MIKSTCHSNSRKLQLMLICLFSVAHIMVLIAIIVITCISLRRWISINCETSCIERWNNLHRRNPFDFKTWKKTLCPLLGYRNCTHPFKITLVDTSEFISHDTCPKNKLLINCSVWGSYILYANLKQHATEYQRYKNDNKEIEYYFHGVYINRISIPFNRTNAAELSFKTENNNVNKSFMLTYKAYNTYRSDTVRKRSTIFSLHHFIEDPEILIRPLVFQLFDANESYPLPPMDLSQLLTFVAAVDFKTNCFEFSNLTPLQENLSIDKELFGTNIYISEDDKTYLNDWILFRCTVYFLFIYIAIAVWGLTSQLLKSNNLYLYSHESNRHIFLGCPSLISNKRASSDYLLKIAYFRKFYIVGSSYVTTIAFFSIVRTVLFYFVEDKYLSWTGKNKNDIIFFIYTYEGSLSFMHFILLLLFFIVELIVNKFKFYDRNFKLIPEPTEAVESLMPVSSIFCQISSAHTNLASRLKNLRLLKNMHKEILRLYLSHKNVFHFNLAMWCVIIYHTSIGAYLNTYSLEISLIIAYTLFSANALHKVYYWTFRCFVWYYLMIIIYPLLLLTLQFIVYNLMTYVPDIYTNRIWIPFMILVVSYLKDVFIEHYDKYSDFLENVLGLIESQDKETDIQNRYIVNADNTDNPKNIAVLAAGRRVDANICNGSNTYTTHSGVMIFYNNFGTKSVTSNFVLKINKLSQEYLSKIPGTVISEFSSLFIRMLPAVLIFWLLRHIDKFPIQTIDVYTFLVGTFLMQAYRRICLHRGRSKNDITRTIYFKNCLFNCVRSHHDEFDISYSDLKNISITSYIFNKRYVLCALVLIITLLTMKEFFVTESGLFEILFQIPYLQNILSFVSISTFVFYVFLII